jgi:ATP-binding cassette subfamily B (MDR/TAP) protein 1
MQYFRAVMGKDSAWFDSNNPNEIATKIVKECAMIYRGIGEKIGGLYAIFAQIIVGLTIAFYISWELSLIIFGGIPVIMVAAIIGVKAGSIGVKEEMIAYQQCAGLAEQSLQSVKVVHTYGREELESTNYNKYLVRTYE